MLYLIPLQFPLLIATDIDYISSLNIGIVVIDELL